MPNYRRVFIKGGTYFFTVVTFERNPIFLNKTAISQLQLCVEIVRHTLPFTVEAFVVLPDHLHSIWTLPSDDDDYSVRWKMIKSSFSRICQPNNNITNISRLKKGERGVWQRRFWEHVIRNEEDYNAHCDYIHYNPVKHGLVKAPDEWEFSSYHTFTQQGYYEVNWGNEVPDKIVKMECE